LPAAFLLLAWWKRGMLGFRRDVLPTLPFFAVALAMCAVTAWLEKHHAGAHGPDYALSFPERLLVAGRAFWFYLAKLLWPAKLAFSYPRWSIDAAKISQWLYPLAALALFAVLVRARGRLGRGPLAAALFFLGALFPLLGFVDVYYMRYAFVCDHWAYLPSLGPLALAGVGLAALAKRLGGGWLSRTAPAVVLLLALGALARRQTPMYADAETLWRATLERNPSSWFAHNNLGNTLFRQGRADDAMAEFDSALRLKPDLPEAHTSLGVARASRGDLVAAVSSFREAIRLKADYADPHFDLGLAFERMGEPDAAAAEYREALRLKPSLVVAQRRLSALERRARQGR
jgi:tetratricopeptide (TPR) repeat protein